MRRSRPCSAHWKPPSEKMPIRHFYVYILGKSAIMFGGDLIGISERSESDRAQDRRQEDRRRQRRVGSQQNRSWRAAELELGIERMRLSQLDRRASAVVLRPCRRTRDWHAGGGAKEPTLTAGATAARRDAAPHWGAAACCGSFLPWRRCPRSPASKAGVAAARRHAAPHCGRGSLAAVHVTGTPSLEAGPRSHPHSGRHSCETRRSPAFVGAAALPPCK